VSVIAKKIYMQAQNRLKHFDKLWPEPSPTQEIWPRSFKKIFCDCTYENSLFGKRYWSPRIFPLFANQQWKFSCLVLPITVNLFSNINFIKNKLHACWQMKPLTTAFDLLSPGP